jgi:AraC-like DNA-binding protein
MDARADPMRLLQVRRVHHAGFIHGMVPWGVRGNVPHQALMRVRGAPCWALYRGSDPVGVKVEDGDLVIFLESTGESQLTDAFHSQAEAILRPMRLGGLGALTKLCGASFELDEVPRSVRAQLRPLLVIPSSEIEAQPMLAHLMDAFEAEVSARRDAQPLVVARLLESILAMALRCEGRPLVASGLPPLDALSADRYVGKAFRLLGERPGHEWSVGDLATSVGLSRRSFTRRFTRELGVAPKEHLARQRMELAMQLLRTTDLDVGEVASWIGYDSVAAFCRAFRRRQGVSPNRFRKACRAAN